MGGAMSYPLVCCPVAMYPRPPFKATRQRCGDCGQQVWVSHSAPPHGRLVCLDCFEEQARPGDVIVPLTEEQARELAAAIKKERMQ